MCVMCNEVALEEYFHRLPVRIGDQGLAIIPVGTRIENKGWAYTIGLIESKDHPELLGPGTPWSVPWTSCVSSPSR